MKELTTRVGNLKVIAEETRNFFDDITVMVLNGSDIIAQDIYTNRTLENATDDILQKLDYLTENYILEIADIEKLSANTYKSNAVYFCRIDNTKYFKRLEEDNGWTVDKYGKRIIDR